MDQSDKEQHAKESELAEISPFEIRNKLIDLAKGKKRITRTMLDAGRGNPNWIAATQPSRNESLRQKSRIHHQK